MALLFTILTAISLGVGDFFAGQATKKASAVTVVLYAQLLGFVLILPIVVFGSHTFIAGSLIWGTLAGLSLGAGFLFYFQALSLGKMGIVASITGILSAMLPVMTGLFLGERPGGFALLAILIIVLAVIPIAKKSSSASEEPSKSDANAIKIFLFAGAAGLLIGVFFVFLHIPSASSGMFTVLFTMLGSVLAVVAVIIFTKQSFHLAKNQYGYVGGTGLLQTFATVTYIIGVDIGFMSIVALGGALSALFTVICARLFIQEKLSKVQISGVIMALSGIVLLVFTT